jgi:hypothetical protein
MKKVVQVSYKPEIPIIDPIKTAHFPSISWKSGLIFYPNTGRPQLSLHQTSVTFVQASGCMKIPLYI